MSSLVAAVARSERPIFGRGASRASVMGAHRWRTPPAVLWPICVALQVVCAIWATSYTYFFFDDFLFLRQAQTEHFGVTYLRGPLFEHFSPVSRILNTALVHIAPGSFTLAHSVQLAIYAAAIGAFALVVRTILGNSWSAFALTAIFGQSVFLMRMLHWWTATANTLPSSVFMLLAIAGYLRWRLTGSRAWLVTSLLADVGALLDYETAMLFPAYLALISLFMLEDRFSLRAWLTRLWRERWLWLCYVVLAGAALVNYYEYYYSPTAHPSIHEFAHFLWVALFESFVPALVGIKDPEAPLSSHTAVVVVAVLFVVAAVACLIYLRPRAWRALAAFAVVFLVTMVPIGLNRVKAYGVGVGQELDYQQSLHFMTLVLAALGLSRRWGGQRDRHGARSPIQLAGRLDRRALAALGAAAVAGYGGLYVSSVKAMAHASWEPRVAHAYVENFLAGVDRVRKSTGHEPVLIDQVVPAEVMFTAFAPYNRYDEFLALVDSELRVDQIVSTAYVINPKGHLEPVRFRKLAGGLLKSAVVTDANGASVAPARSGGGSSACIPDGRPASRLHVRLSRAQAMAPRASGFPYAVRVRYTTPARRPVVIILASASGAAVDELVQHVWGPGAGGEIAPLSQRIPVEEVDFELPAEACVTGMEFGTFSPAGPLV